MWIRSSEFFVCLLVVVCWFFLVWSLFACFVLVRGWSLSWPFLSTPSFHSVSLAKHLQSISLFFSRSHSSDRGIAPQRHYTSKTKTVLFQKLHRHGSDKRCFQDQFAFVIGQPRETKCPSAIPQCQSVLFPKCTCTAMLVLFLVGSLLLFLFFWVRFAVSWFSCCLLTA